MEEIEDRVIKQKKDPTVLVSDLIDISKRIIKKEWSKIKNLEAEK